MIRIDRGLADRDGAEGLATIEQRALATLLPTYQTTQQHPDGAALEDFDYRVAGLLLWRRQHQLCAYCESPEQRRRNDVEHFRPKARADRGPHHTQTWGYWWLAWRWENLLFACRNCNQSLRDAKGSRGKVDRFPLAQGSGVLVPPQDPFGAHAHVEKPLLLDPSCDDAIDHIEFRRITLPGGEHRWTPFPRNQSLRGRTSIHVLALDRDDLLELYNRHVECVVEPAVETFRHAVQSTPGSLLTHWQACERRLLTRGRPYAALAYDALGAMVSDTELGLNTPRRRPPI